MGRGSGEASELYCEDYWMFNLAPVISQLPVLCRLDERFLVVCLACQASQ